MENMDFLFISFVSWSYKQIWQYRLRTQKNKEHTVNQM